MSTTDAHRTQSPPRAAYADLRAAGGRGRALAAGRRLRDRARGVLGTTRGPGPRRGDAALLARRARADRRWRRQRPVPFGRTGEDPIRIGIIERERTLPLRVLFARIDDGLAAWAERLGTLTDGDRARVGLHPRLGEMVVDDLAERFVLGHAEDHVAQLETILADPA